MVYKGVSFNTDWMKGKTESEFVAEFVDAFVDCDHELANLTKPQRIKWLKEAFQLLSGFIKGGGV